VITQTELNTLWLSWKVYEPSYKQMIKEITEAGYTFVSWIDKKESDTQVLIVSKGRNLYIITRGTTFNNPRDWYTNFKFNLVPHVCELGRAHAGFYNDALSVEADIKVVLSNDQMSHYIFGGHSQGAAVTEQHVLLHPFALSVTAGTPRSMDADLANHMSRARGVSMIHYANNNDIVHRIPPRGMGYRHVDCTLKYFDHRGRLVINPGKNYLRGTRIIGRLQSLLRLKSDGLIDHYPEKYYRLARAAR